jgi:hypothetical protein
MPVVFKGCQKPLGAFSVTSGEFSSHFAFQFFVLLEQKLSSHRMRVGILVVILNTTSCVPLPELIDQS